MPANVNAQLAIDETQVENEELEAALEERLKRKHSRDELNKQYTKAHENVVGLIESAKIEIPADGAVRIGRFRLTLAVTPARSVSFDTAAKERVKIEADDDD